MSSNYRYRTKRWRLLRKRVLNEDPLCARCKEQGIFRSAKEVDHIVPVKKDPDRFFDLENLQGLCVKCHIDKTAAENRSVHSPRLAADMAKWDNYMKEHWGT